MPAAKDFRLTLLQVIVRNPPDAIRVILQRGETIRMPQQFRQHRQIRAQGTIPCPESNAWRPFAPPMISAKSASDASPNHACRPSNSGSKRPCRTPWRKPQVANSKGGEPPHGSVKILFQQRLDIGWSTLVRFLIHHRAILQQDFTTCIFPSLAAVRRGGFPYPSLAFTSAPAVSNNSTRSGSSRLKDTAA